MKFVVDTNIVFSAILNSQGKIANLIINGSKHFDFFTVSLLQGEIESHREKIMALTGFSNAQFAKIYQIVTDRINFVDEILLSDTDIKNALAITHDIDENDTLFVALNNLLNSRLWTGDKKLVNGLESKGYTKTISTTELNELFIERQLKNKKRL
jgi:predicted nucleic acid-binding protein